MKSKWNGASKEEIAQDRREKARMEYARKATARIFAEQDAAMRLANETYTEREARLRFEALPKVGA